MSDSLLPSVSGADDRAGLLFIEALRHDPGERDEFVRRECGLDVALQSEVEQLLVDHGEAGNFLRGNALAPTDRRGGNVPLPAEEPGGTIGPYKLLQQIGEGGCGVVWMAEQTVPVRRRVALKVIKLGMDTKEVIARFEAERQALALMEHPNIAKVLDAGATEAGRPYFVMELVRGIKITDYCDRNHLPTEARLVLFNQVCQAIQHAHQKGIIHRDIKPSNILVTLHDGVPVPRVIDFGIAKATTGQRLTDKTFFTAFEQFVGTPAYMSPEQAEMSGLDIDTRSDIYALGVLLYELLTGRTPFDARELMAVGLDAMRRIIREQEPVRPSTRLSTLMAADLTTVAQQHQSDGLKLTHHLRGDLDSIVMKALEKDRTRRYESASAFALDVQRHLDHEPVVARPPSTAYRFRKMVRRNRLAVASAGAVLMALVTGLGISTWLFFKERHARERSVAAEEEQGRLRQVAEGQERKAVAESAKSRQVAKLLTDMLQGVGPSVALGQDTKLLRGILDKAVVHIGQDLKDQPEVEADLRTIVGKVYVELGDYDQGVAMHEEALAIRKRLFGDEHPDVASSLHNLAQNITQPDSETMHREALTMRRKLLGNGHADVAESLVSLTINLRGQGKFAEGETLASEAVTIAKQWFSNEHPRVALALLALASVVGHQGRFAESAAIHLEVLAMRRKLLGEFHPGVAESLSHLADVTESQSKWVESVDFARQSLEMDRKLLGEDHPETGRMHYRVASLLVKGGKLPEAEAKFREALALKRARRGDDHHDIAQMMRELGSVCQLLNKLPAAELLFRDSLAIYRKLDGDEHVSVADGLNLQAGVCINTFKYAEAELMLLNSLSIFRKLFGNDHKDVATLLGNLAVALYYQGQLPEAVARWREALGIYKTLADTPQVARAQVNLSQVLGAQNNLTEAVSVMREGVAAYRSLAPQFARERASAIVGLASRLRRSKNYAEAEALCREVIAEGVIPLGGRSNAAMSAEAFLSHVLIDWSWDERSSSSPATQPQIAERAHEAVRLLTACMAVPQSPETADSQRVAGRLSILLGGAFLSEAVTDPALTGQARQAKFAEAEKAMLDGDEKMRQAQAKVDMNHRRDAVAFFVRLYEGWGRTDKAILWKKKYDALIRGRDRGKPVNAANPPVDPANPAAGPSQP